MTAGRTSSFLKIVLGAAFVAVLAAPFVLKPPREKPVAGPVRPDMPARKLVIISPHWEGIRTEFSRAFSEWTQARFGYVSDLEWLDVGGTSDAIRYVKSKFAKAPDGIGVDLFFGGGVDPYMQFTRENLLVPCPVPDEVLAPIPRTFAGIEVYDTNHLWFGTVLSGFGIVYNRKVCGMLGLPEPRTWSDLARPEYFSWVGSGDPRSSGSIHMAYEIILQACGWQEGWANLVRMCGNTRNFSRAAAEVPKDTAMGEIACGMAIDVYGWRQVAEVGADRMGFCLPEGATVINPDGIGILKGAPNRDVAEKFVEFVISEQGQKLWSLKKGAAGGPRQFELDRMPVIPGFAARFGADAAIPYDPYQWKSGFVYDAKKGSLRWNILNDLLGAVLIDTHAELAPAWNAARKLPGDDARVRGLLTPPISEEELLKMAEGQWDDAEFRARTRTRWANEARERYARLAGAVL